MPKGDTVIGWFERNDYPHVLKVMEDAHKLPPTFEEWEKHSKAGEQELLVKGIGVVRTIIKPDEFVSWCRKHGLKADAPARLRFGDEQAAAPAH